MTINNKFYVVEKATNKYPFQWEYPQIKLCTFNDCIADDSSISTINKWIFFFIFVVVVSNDKRQRGKELMMYGSNEYFRLKNKTKR